MSAADLKKRLEPLLLPLQIAVFLAVAYAFINLNIGDNVGLPSGGTVTAMSAVVLSVVLMYALEILIAKS
ncbi:hypothetical protein [Haloarcula sp. CGMCC 1.2071]|uniref:hypothetical protein n=1 Tax=Haloarcula sp. CGMCC 1.2071 TaxID=3111454 RepID=UPI00300F538B